MSGGVRLRRRPRALVGLLLAATAAAVAAVLAGDDGRPSAANPLPVLRIYSSLPFGAQHNRAVPDVERAIRIALAERAGRAGRFAIDYVPLDSSGPGGGKDWKPEQVAANARRAARDPRAIAYLGELSSGASTISIPILGRAGLLQVSPGSPYSGLTRTATGGRRTFVRVMPPDHLQAAATVAWMRQLRTRRLAVVRIGSPVEDALADMVAGRARAAGIRVRVLRMRVHRLATIRDAAAAAARWRADTAYFGGIWQDRAPALWGRLHRADPAMRLMGGDGLADPAFTNGIFRTARARTYITRPWLPARRFRARFHAAYKRYPTPEAVYGYEAMRLVLDAIARLGARGGDRSAVVEAAFATRGRESVLGRYSIDRNGDTTLPFYGGYRVNAAGALTFDRVLDSSR